MSRATGRQGLWSPRAARTRWPAGVIGCAVLALAVLNPLLCIAHCAWATHHAAWAEAGTPFLCDLGHSSSSAASPQESAWNGPRAVYEAVPLPSLALPLTILILAVCSIAPALAPQCRPSPTAPPPKASAPCP